MQVGLLSLKVAEFAALGILNASLFFGSQFSSQSQFCATLFAFLIALPVNFLSVLSVVSRTEPMLARLTTLPHKVLV
ncbi:hypothetical protein L596_015503 [Steinernema carpocapsae]|uniref:Uncharacterized protein n=1 Tax=Steinernema carpocapsae TaxID=34508 RepID=A0A4U5NFC3_STECR|nr:hypothetical protein L596_015503 [Steinernema carpocapsae]